MRALLLVGLLVLTGLAGCTDDAPAPDAATEEPGVITDPKDLSDMQNGTGFHFHDYWGGADELEVLWYSKNPTYNNLGGTGSVWTSSFFPPDESVVPQGTSELRIVASWADTVEAANSYGAMDVWAKPANAVEPRLVAADVISGEDLVLSLDYNESDLPHQLVSAWEFQIRIHGSSGPYNAFLGRLTMQVTAVRGLELRAFPPHPDQWQNRTDILLAEEEGNFSQFTYTGTGSFDPRIGSLAGALVPYGADHVEVVLDAVNSLPAGGIQLAFHGADTRDWTVLTPDSDAGGHRVYTIPVGEGMADGPYAEASLWEFLISTSDDTGGGAFDGDYHLTATVHKDA